MWKGRLDMTSKTAIRGEAIDSRNRIVLKDHQFAGKMGKQLSVGAIAGPVLVEALNGVNPVKLNFDITGTLDKPEFGGLVPRSRTDGRTQDPAHQAG